MKKLIYIFILFLFASAILISCGDGECNLDTKSLLTCDIQVADTNLSKLNFLDSLSIYSPEWTDSIHFSEDGSETNLSLMLSPNSSLTELIFSSKSDSKLDTIIFYHQSELIFLSPECGFILNFEIDSFKNTFNNIDSLELINSSILNDEDGQIQIYF